MKYSRNIPFSIFKMKKKLENCWRWPNGRNSIISGCVISRRKYLWGPSDHNTYGESNVEKSGRKRPYGGAGRMLTIP